MKNKKTEESGECRGRAEKREAREVELETTSMQSKMGAGLPRVATSGYIDGVAQGKGEMKMRMRVRVRECHRVYFRVFVVCVCV